MDARREAQGGGILRWKERGLKVRQGMEGEEVLATEKALPAREDVGDGQP
jgi:hypothetical protein